MSLKWPLIGLGTAIAVTTSMDATGLANFSALPLLLLTCIFWYWERFSKKEIGLVWGKISDYGLAVAYPLIVLGAITLIVFLTGATNTADADWKKAGLNMALMSTVGIIGVVLTEEGFFRGWLWASLKKAGLDETQVLIWSSVAFSLWHVSAVTMETDFSLPLGQIPVYLINAAIIGAIWGILRYISGSVLVAGVSHAVWNGLDYPLFGFGTEEGALGVVETALYGPEVGILGLMANAIFAVLLWHWISKRQVEVMPP